MDELGKAACAGVAGPIVFEVATLRQACDAGVAGSRRIRVELKGRDCGQTADHLIVSPSIQACKTFTPWPIL